MPGQVLFVLGLVAFEIAGTFGASRGQPDREAVDPVAIALVVAAALPLVWRRRYPLPVLVVSHSIVLAYWLLGYPGGPIFLSPLIAFFTAVLHGQRIGAWIVLAVGFVGFTFGPTVVSDEPAPTIEHVVGVAAWLLVIAAAADLLRVRRERMAEADRMHEEEARRRASEERLRIARELHDVLAHNISMINVQAGVALHLLD
ncbi:MAG: histidine kinase, partial [Gaiellales bacterium]